MASKKKRSKQSKKATLPPQKLKRADHRPYIYATLDFCFVALYLVLAVFLIPGRAGTGIAMQWGLVLAMSAAGVGMLRPDKRGWRLAIVGCSLMLLAEVLLLILLLVSASYLAGVYGSFGRGASSLALVVAVLSIQLVALVPALQLKYLLTRSGRSAFGMRS